MTARAAVEKIVNAIAPQGSIYEMEEALRDEFVLTVKRDAYTSRQLIVAVAGPDEVWIGKKHVDKRSENPEGELVDSRCFVATGPDVDRAAEWGAHGLAWVIGAPAEQPLAQCA